MLTDPISRRAFFGQAAAVPATGLVSASVKPKEAWIIVARGWDYNDEFTFEDGESPLRELYYDKAQADAECRRLCDAFFAAEKPFEFPADFAFYLPERVAEPDFDEEIVTWDELRRAGFPDPYTVLKLNAPDEKP